MDCGIDGGIITFTTNSGSIYQCNVNDIALSENLDLIHHSHKVDELVQLITLNPFKFYKGFEKSTISNPFEYDITGMKLSEYLEYFSKDINSLINESGVLIIPDDIAIIDDCDLEFAKFKKVFIPSTVKKIGVGAFSNCELLERVIIPPTIKEIGASAFRDCKLLERIEFEKKEYSELSKIGYGAFSGCKSLKSFGFPHGVEEIDNHVFFNCEALEYVEFSKQTKKIGIGTFFGCKLLNNVNFSNVEEIDNYAFSECESLTNFKMSNSITRIGENAFEHCDLLKEINIKETPDLEEKEQNRTGEQLIKCANQTKTQEINNLSTNEK